MLASSCRPGLCLLPVWPPRLATAHPLALSGCCRGVSWCKRRSLWEAAISINGKRERLGFYRTEEAAARAYDVVACWRNAEMRRQLAEREAQGAPSGRRRTKRKRGKEGGEGESEAEGEEGPRPAVRRIMVQALPLNVPADAPAAGSPQLRLALKDLLLALRGARAGQEGPAGEPPRGRAAFQAASAAE